MTVSKRAIARLLEGYDRLGRAPHEAADLAGNSVKGRLVAQFLSRRLGLDLLGSEPVR